MVVYLPPEIQCQVFSYLTDDELYERIEAFSEIRTGLLREEKSPSPRLSRYAITLMTGVHTERVTHRMIAQLRNNLRSGTYFSALRLACIARAKLYGMEPPYTKEEYRRARRFLYGITLRALRPSMRWNVFERVFQRHRQFFLERLLHQEPELLDIAVAGHRVAETTRRQFPPTQFLAHLIEAGADPDLPDLDEFIPLHTASAIGNVGHVRFLASRTQNIDQMSTSRYTPLHTACQRGHTTAARILLRHNASCNIQDHLGKLPLYYVLENGDESLAVEVLERTDPELIAQDQRALHHAAAGNCIHLIEPLIECGCHPSARNRNGSTPASIAAACGHTSLAMELLAREASIPRNRVDFDYPLLCAAQNGDLPLATFLLDAGASIDGVDDNTPLHCAAEKGQIAMIEFLLSRGADPTVEHGFSAAAMAARNGHTDATIQLLNAEEEVSDEVDYTTPLCFLLGTGNVTLAEELVERGANPRAVFFSGTPLLSLALHRNDIPCFRYLLDLLHREDLNQRDSHGETALHIATRLGNIEVVELLLERGANPNIAGGAWRRTPYMIGSPAIRALLQRYGASTAPHGSEMPIQLP